MSITRCLSAITLLAGLTACHLPLTQTVQTDEPTEASAEAAAAPPETDIHIGTLSWDETRLDLKDVRPLATSAGYENQPAFVPGGEALYYVAAGPTGKTDIWHRALTADTPTQITNSPGRSEYSPRQMSDQQAISFIHETPSGDLTYVHKLQEDAETSVIDLNPVGYYAFLNAGTAVLVFFRSEPATLIRVDIASGASEQIAENIGRALYAPLNNEIAFYTTTNEDETYQVHRYDDKTRSSTFLFELVGQSQDYAVFKLPDQDAFGFLSADGTVLYYRTDRPQDTWQKVADLTGANIGKISRLAINDQLDRLALVTEP